MVQVNDRFELFNTAIQDRQIAEGRVAKCSRETVVGYKAFPLSDVAKFLADDTLPAAQKVIEALFDDVSRGDILDLYDQEGLVS